MGDVWDSSGDVLAARERALAGIALLAFLLPLSVRAAVVAWGGPSPGAAALSGVIALAGLPLILWGLMAVVAVATDAKTTRAQAGARALRRLPAALLVTLVAAAAAIVLTLPVIAVLVASGFDFQAATAEGGGTMDVGVGAGVFLFLYAIALLIAVLWASARLFLMQPVIVNEERALGAYGRSFRLTRGLTWKLIGVTLLFAIIQSVAAFAARSVVFVVFRLLLGPAQLATATWLGAVAEALVTSAYIVVVGVFAARLYATVTAGPRA